MVLSGFADKTGNAAYNRALSEKRVNAASTELQGYGIASNRITTNFFGEEKPTAPNTSDKFRGMNRRVEIRVN